MREEGTWCGEAPSACRGCRAPSLVERAAGMVPAAGGNGSVPEREGVCKLRHPGCSMRAWPLALAEMQKKRLANHGKVRGLWKHAVFAVAVAAADDDGDDADAEPPYHCYGDGPSRSLVAETANRRCRGG